MLQAGIVAPEFQLPDAAGMPVNLSDLRGKIVVLYFYPRADTPGCTREACAFRDVGSDFDGAGAVIVGVSPDTPSDQRKFADKYGLPFRLLGDADHQVAEAYGCWVEKNNYGKKYMGVQRSTFIIGPDGMIEKVFPKVSVDGHAEEVLAAVKALENKPAA
jgi:peroxiredoxin Q/BCP